MGDIIVTLTREELNKKRLCKELLPFINKHDFIVIIGYTEDTQEVDIQSNLDYSKDRVLLRGIIDDAKEELNRFRGE